MNLKNLLFSILIMILPVTFLISCNSSVKQEKAVASEKLDFKQHEQLKLGFTTQNFAEIAPVSLASAKQFIDYAATRGFVWLELRDPAATLTLEECKEIAAYAKEKDVEVGYAIQKGLLDEDFWTVFEKGLKNAAVFDGPKTFRMLAGGQEFTADTEKKGWNETEMQQVVQFADSAAALAKKNGLQLVIENGTEALFGNAPQYYGFSDIFMRTSDEVGWQFDTANPFSVSRTHPSSDSVRAFLSEHINDLYYIHLKSSQDGEVQETLTPNPLAFGDIFQIMASGEVPYIAIELQGVDDKDQAYGNMESSVKFLQEQGFIVNP